MSPRDASNAVGTLFLAEIERGYHAQKSLAERALDQLEPEDWHRVLDDGSNSVAVIVRHLAGNLRSRWRDFLTSDGEKADRQRDDEFEEGDHTVPSMLAEWEVGFSEVYGTLAGMTPADLNRTITIRGEELNVVRAMLRNLEHTSHHVGQIVMLAKHWRGDQWRTLSIPKKPKA